MVNQVVISSAVDRAFEAFDDIAEDAVFTTGSVTEFDYNTGLAVTTGATSTIKLIPYEKGVDSDDTPYFMFIGRESDFGFSNYDSFTIDSKNYRIETQEFFPGIVQIRARGGQ